MKGTDCSMRLPRIPGGLRAPSRPGRHGGFASIPAQLELMLLARDVSGLNRTSSYLPPGFTCEIAARGLPSSERQPSLSTRINAVGPARRSVEPSSIYAVDDLPCLTDLYRGALQPKGYAVTAFNDRAAALAALRTDRELPTLLITDYLGGSLPIDEFLHACRQAHPQLRILMASGLVPDAMHFCLTRPDGFLLKPFSLEDLEVAVNTVLAGD